MWQMRVTTKHVAKFGDDRPSDPGRLCAAKKNEDRSNSGSIPSRNKKEEAMLVTNRQTDGHTHRQTESTTKNNRVLARHGDQ